MVPGFDASDFQQNPTLSGLYLRKELLYTLRQKAYGLRKLAKLQPNHPDAIPEIAYETVQLAVDLIDSLKTDYADDADKQLLVGESYPIIELGLELVKELFAQQQDPQYLSAAYRMMEKSRAVALYQSLKTARAQDFAGIPADLQDEERDYRYRLNVLRDSLQQQADPAENPARLQRFQALKQDYQQLIQRFENQYPDYYRLKYEQEILSLAEVQTRLLHPESSLLEYFVGDEHVYLLDIRPDTLHFFQLTSSEALRTQIQAFRSGIYDYFVSDSAYDDDDYLRLSERYADAAYWLYEQLFAPYQSERLSLPSELVIVPDGMLGYLPFGALLRAPSENASLFQQHEYLLRSHAISYMPSASLWGEMTDQATLDGKGSLLAFAPIFSGESAGMRSSWIRDSLALQALPYTAKELADIQTVFPADTFLNGRANLDHFHELAGQYRLIHLATHGVLNDADPDQSFLAFYPGEKRNGNGGRLMLRDLYAMDIPAELVVLSACETGIGRFSRGEGLLSLARGFSYAGTHSLLATLWRIPDGEVNQDLLPNFYQALQEGATKVEAIRSAQLAQINEAFSDQMAHPFFWAAFTPIGDMRPLQKDGFLFWWGFLVGLLGVGAVVWWRRRAR
ncbi:MAG: CHAT domain-containing protein [Bacteroidota bacterium]